MKRFMTRQLLKQHKSFKPRLYNTGIGSGLQRKLSPKIISKHKSSNLAKLNKANQSKDLVSLKTQLCSFLSYLTWKRLASPLVESVLPNLIYKTTLQEINNVGYFKKIEEKDECEICVKCCEQPEPFDIGEKICFNCSNKNTINTLDFEISEKKKKRKLSLPLHTKAKKHSTLFNHYLPLKKAVCSTIQMLIPNISNYQSLEKIQDFRHEDNNLNVDSNFLNNKTNLSSSKTFLMGRDTSQVVVNAQDVSMPLVGVELEPHVKITENARISRKVGRNEIILNHTNKPTTQLKKKQSAQNMREKLDLNLKPTRKHNKNPLKSVHKKKSIVSEKLSGIHFPPKGTSNENRKGILTNDQVCFTDKNTLLKESFQPQKSLNLKSNKGNPKKRHLKNLSITKISKNVKDRRERNKEEAVKESNSTNNQTNPDLKDFLLAVERNRTGKQSKENIGLVKVDITVSDETYNKVKGEEGSSQVTNETSLGIRREVPNHLQSNQSVFDGKSSNLAVPNFIHQPILRNNLNRNTRSFELKTRLSNESLKPPKSLKFFKKSNDCIKDRTSFDSTLFKEENDCLQSTRYMLKKLQEYKVPSETSQGKKVKGSKVTMERNTVCIDETNVQQLKDPKNRIKLPIDKKKNTVYKSNFVVFDTHSNSGQLLVKEQNVALGEGIRNDLVTFEQVLRKENDANLKSFNKNNEKHTKKTHKINYMSDNSTDLKPWRPQKENLDGMLSKHISDGTMRKQEEETNFSKPSFINTSKNKLIQISLENTSINNFRVKKPPLECKETNEAQSDSVKEQAHLNKKVADIHFKATTKEIPLYMTQGWDGGNNSKKAKQNKANFQKSDNPTLPAETPLKGIESNKDINISNNVSDSKTVDNYTAPSLNQSTHGILKDFISEKEKLPLQNLSVLSEIKPHDKHFVPKVKVDNLKINVDSFVPPENLNRPNPKEENKLKKDQVHYTHNSKECIGPNTSDSGDSKILSLKLEAEKNAQRYTKEKHLLKKTCSLSSHPVRQELRENAKHKATSTSVDAIRKNSSTDTAKCNVVSNTKKIEVKGTDTVLETPETNINSGFKENRSHILNQTPAKKTQSETNNHSSSLYDKSNNISAIPKNAKNKAADNIMHYKSNMETLKKSRGEIKLKKSSSLNSVKTERVENKDKMYGLSNTRLNEKMIKTKMRSELLQQKIHSLDQVDLGKENLEVQKNIKVEVAAKPQVDTYKITAEKTSVKHTLDLNLSQRSSKNKVSKVKSHTDVSAPKKDTLIGRKQNTNFNSGQTVINQNNVISAKSATNVLVKTSKLQCNQVESAKHPLFGSKNMQINSTENVNEQPEKKFKGPQNKNQMKSNSNLNTSEKQDTIQAVALLESSKSDQNIVNHSKTVHSEKKKLKSKLKKLLHGLSITGQQDKYMMIRGETNIQNSFQKDANSGQLRQDIKHQTSDKMKDDVLLLTSAKKNIAVKTEVLKPMNCKNETSSWNKPVSRSNLVKGKTSVIEKGLANSETKIDRIKKVNLSFNTNTFDISKANTNLNNKMKLNARQEVMTQVDAGTQMSNIEQVSHLPQKSRVTTKQKVSASVKSGETNSNSKTYIK